MVRWRLTSASPLVLAAAGCFSNATLGLPCSADAECKHPETCVKSVCAVVGGDGGTSGPSGSGSAPDDGAATSGDDGASGGSSTTGGVGSGSSASSDPTSDPTSATGSQTQTTATATDSMSGGTMATSSTDMSATSTTMTTAPGTTTADTSSVTTTAMTTGGTTTQPTQDYLLQHHDGDCDTILWCTTGMGGNKSGYGPHEFAECFRNVTPTTPFDLLQVRYDVGGFEASMNNVVRLRVYGWDSANSTPDSLNLIGSQDLTPADVELLGPHTIAVNPAISIDAKDFCVSIDSDGPFGVTRDETNYIPDLSFQIDQCGTGDWEELEDLGFGGNWCMSATIRGRP